MIRILSFEVIAKTVSGIHLALQLAAMVLFLPALSSPAKRDDPGCPLKWNICLSLDFNSPVTLSDQVSPDGMTVIIFSNSALNLTWTQNLPFLISSAASKLLFLNLYPCHMFWTLSFSTFLSPLQCCLCAWLIPAPVLEGKSHCQLFYPTGWQLRLVEYSKCFTNMWLMNKWIKELIWIWYNGKKHMTTP